MAEQIIDLDTCAICGTRAATTRDHVPPKSIFPKPLPSDLVTVPACGNCNSGSSPSDEEFKVGLSMLAGMETPETLKLWKDGVMRTLAHNRRMHREVMDRFVQVDVRSPGGIYLHTREAILIPKQPIHSVLERTIRGLYYHHFGEALGTRARCDVQQFQERGDNTDIGNFVMSMPPGSIGNGLLRYRFARAEDSPLSSLWFMLFFGKVPVFGYTIDASDPWQPGQPVTRR